jgi:Zn-dependent protease with chaperone function
VFGPGFRVTGAPATLQIAGEMIIVQPSREAAGAGDGATGERLAGELVVAAADLELRRVGADDKGLELAWTSFEHGGEGLPVGDRPTTPGAGFRQSGPDAAGRARFACHVLDAPAASRLLAALPGGAYLDRQVVTRYDESRRILRAVTMAGVVLFVLLPLALVVLLLTNLDGLTNTVVARIPPAREQALRDEYVRRFVDDPRFRQQGARYRVVSDLGDRLTALNARYEYVYFIADDPAVNAFALPGGLVVVNDGLIDATRSAEELAGVLAHEVQHVELRHGLAAVVREAGLGVVLMLFSGDAASRLGADVGRQLLGLRYSRDAEREADRTGIERLQQSGVDPAGMVNFFAALDRDGDNTAALLSTHPRSAERAQALRAQLEAVPVTALPALRFADVENWPPPP